MRDDINSFLLTIIRIIFACLFSFFVFILLKFNYFMGVLYCNFLKVPLDFTLSVMSPGMALEVTIVLFVFEIIGICVLVSKSKFLNGLAKYLFNLYDFLDW